MSLRISGKHMDIGDALKGRIQERIEDAVDKYFGHGFSGHVTMEKQGAFFMADCMLHLDSGVILQASAREADAHVSFDRAAERIEKRLRRYKRKLKDHHAGGQGAEKSEVAYTVMSTPNEDEELAEDFAPAVVAEGSTSVRTQTVAMAVMQLELMDEPVNVFKNAASGQVNVVYRRSDGNIGWVDPSSEAAG
ncbi:ribosome hibernation-promoting factor, HPF/YfiA family [Pseudahrensia aquimaris]|uniref:Ribosome hibernation promoting factor n=1 Tax=Pseudahrensia aquimaris TaxID=744461 RepID=A0ABW3FEU3_9HYPH